MTALQDISTSIKSTADRVGPAVVGIGRGWGPGSGVVVEAGRVLTVAHAIRGDEPTIRLPGGERTAGTVLGLDPDSDLAVVEADTGDVEPVDWDPEAADVALGDLVFALANPGGRGLRVTPGFVSAAERSFRGPRGRRIRGAIEHTAPLPRGSSGGPLVNADGRLIGLNAIRMEGGLILAIPADAALRERADKLARGESPARRRLGVAVAPPRVAKRMRRAVGLPERHGLLVRGVQEDSPAARAGVQRGDLIVELSGEAVEGVESLYSALDVVSDDTALPLTVVRGTDEVQLSVSFAGNGTDTPQEV